MQDATVGAPGVKPTADASGAVAALDARLLAETSTGTAPVARIVTDLSLRSRAA